MILYCDDWLLLMIDIYLWFDMIWYDLNCDDRFYDWYDLICDDWLWDWYDANWWWLMMIDYEIDMM
jgi:hypothetical protein